MKRKTPPIAITKRKAWQRTRLDIINQAFENHPFESPMKNVVHSTRYATRIMRGLEYVNY